MPSTKNDLAEIDKNINSLGGFPRLKGFKRLTPIEIDHRSTPGGPLADDLDDLIPIDNEIPFPLDEPPLTTPGEDLGAGGGSPSDNFVNRSYFKVHTAVVASDGSADFESIQEAIDSLPEDGGTVFLKDGRFTINTQISISGKDISLIGSGSATEIYMADDANITLINISDADGITISNMKLNGNQENNTGELGNPLIEITNTDNSKFTDLKIPPGVPGTSNVFELSLSENNLITNCTYNDPEDITPIVLYLKAGCNNNIITDNNFVDGQEIATVLLDGQTGTCNNNIISGNILSNGALKTLKLNNASQNIIIGNVINEGLNANIFLSGNSDENVIDGNIIDTTVGNSGNRYGIDISVSTCNKNLITGNIIRNSDTAAINDAGTDTLSANNITT